MIPAGRIDQVGQNIANLFPLPNVPGQANGTLNNYYASPVYKAVGNQFDIRVDHKMNEQNQLVGHSTFEDHPNVDPALMGSKAGGPPMPQGNIKTREQNHAVGYSRMFGTNLLNDLRFAFIRYAVTSATLNNGQNISQSVGIPNANRGTNVTSGLSFINFNGPYSFLGNSFYIPELVRDNTYQLADSVSWVKGKHTIKFGLDYRYYHRNFYQSQAPFGQFNFSGQFSQNLATGDGGDALADALLGLPNFREQDGLAGNNDPTHMWEMGEFLQDDFRVNKHLTLNLGLRYDTFSPVSGSKVGNFDLTKGVVVTNFGPRAVSNAGVGYDHKDFGPRVGISLVAVRRRQDCSPRRLWSFLLSRGEPVQRPGRKSSGTPLLSARGCP
jgi:outer membrane receptor protein involved in Fe transport